MQASIHYNINSLTFGSKKHNKNLGKRHYSAEERALRHEINTAAKTQGWRDIYTGRKFTKVNPSSVEHIIPFSDRNNCEIPDNFQINGLDNLFPAGAIGNGERGNECFALTVSKRPIILERLYTEMEKYEKYKSPLIDGKEWVQRLKVTIFRELSKIS